MEKTNGIGNFQLSIPQMLRLSQITVDAEAGNAKACGEGAQWLLNMSKAGQERPEKYDLLLRQFTLEQILEAAAATLLSPPQVVEVAEVKEEKSEPQIERPAEAGIEFVGTGEEARTSTPEYQPSA